MRKLATIQTIDAVDPIPNADSIERVKVKDWYCVAKKGEFKAGDKCVYFEIDSLMPADIPLFSFLARGNQPKSMTVDGREYKGYRLKTVKLRGQISQGLALPLSSFVSLWDSSTLTGEIGEDVSEKLGIVKYEPPIPASLRGQVKGQFPSFLKKTDEERIQNCADVLSRHYEERFYVAEKLDGTSATYYKRNNELGVCSRNLELLPTEGNTYFEIAKAYDLANQIPENYAVQGEIIGDGIQGNPLGIQGRKFFVFNVYNYIEGRFLNLDEMMLFCYEHGLQTVPIINDNLVLDPYMDAQYFLNMAGGFSKLNGAALKEGIVVRPVTEKVDIINGAEGRLSFKAISNDYLLSEK